MLSAFAVAAEEGSGDINPLLPSLPDLVWGSLAFLIVLALFIWKVLPALNKALDARAEAIEGGLKKAEEAQAAANAAKESYQDQLAEARAEAARIREQARADAQKIAAEVKDQATADAARIVANAQTAIESERTRRARIAAGRGRLARAPARRGVIGESLSEDKKAAAVVDRFIADLKASEGASK